MPPRVDSNQEVQNIRANMATAESRLNGQLRDYSLKIEKATAHELQQREIQDKASGLALQPQSTARRAPEQTTGAIVNRTDSPDQAVQRAFNVAESDTNGAENNPLLAAVLPESSE